MSGDEPATVQDVEKKLIQVVEEATETIKEAKDVVEKATEVIEKATEAVHEVIEIEKKITNMTISEQEMDRLGELSKEEIQSIVADIIAKKYRSSSPAGKESLKVEYDTDDNGKVNPKLITATIEQVGKKAKKDRNTTDRY